MTKAVKRVTQKSRAIFAWFQTILYLLQHRGRATYGSAQLRELASRYVIEKTASLENYQAAERAIADLARLLNPINISGLARIGATKDGGYVGSIESIPELLISGGAGKNIDFELELALLGSKVLIFDPTVRELPKSHFRITHVPKALCSELSQEFKNKMSLSAALALGNHQNFSNVWLKLDIEGSEIELLDDELEILESFSQIFIEFHDTYKLLQCEFREKLIRIISYLNMNFNLISINSNNWQNIFNAGRGFTPVTFEATFINMSIPVERIPEETYLSLLSANNPERLPIPRVPFIYGNGDSGKPKKTD